jgi:DNA-binding GntR family transcriptional regulator
MPGALKVEKLSLAGSLTEAVVDTIRDMVRDGRLVPGTLYSVYQVSEALGVSRSPVREGLLKLAEAGLVSFERNRGFRVNLPQARDVAEIFAVRLALEPAAAARVAASVPPGLAAQLRQTLGEMHETGSAADEDAYWKHDRRLHELILAAAGNNRAAQIVAGLRQTTWLLGSRTSAGIGSAGTGSENAGSARTLAEVTREHEPIVAAIVAGGAAEAAAGMRRHLVRTGRLLVAQALGPDASTAQVDEIWGQVVDSPDAAPARPSGPAKAEKSH